MVAARVLADEVVEAVVGVVEVEVDEDAVSEDAVEEKQDDSLFCARCGDALGLLSVRTGRAPSQRQRF